MSLLRELVLELPQYLVHVEVSLGEDSTHALLEVGLLCILDVGFELGLGTQAVDLLILGLHLISVVQGRLDLAEGLLARDDVRGVVGGSVVGEASIALRGLDEDVLLDIWESKVYVAGGFEVRALVFVGGGRQIDTEVSLILLVLLLDGELIW
jgi:hypothetical protein